MAGAAGGRPGQRGVTTRNSCCQGPRVHGGSGILSGLRTEGWWGHVLLAQALGQSVSSSLSFWRVCSSYVPKDSLNNAQGPPSAEDSRDMPVLRRAPSPQSLPLLSWGCQEGKGRGL